MTESIQITELSMKDYEFVNRAYHVLHKEHVNGRPDIYCLLYTSSITAVSSYPK